MPTFIAKTFGLKLEDAKKWYDGVDIVASSTVDPEAILKAQRALVVAGVLSDSEGSLKASDFTANLSNEKS